MAYVFGFRKHEQGQNAVEIPQFDALIEQQEQQIAVLRSLQGGKVEIPEPQIESKYAEFTAQPTPEFTIADGLEVKLWAENPMLNKPIHMNFDAKGRLWIASSEAYPMIEVGQSMPDKILVLEDTNQDGKADRSEIFADGLLIPTGVVPGDGGVYVAQSTDLLFLKDTDDDGKADLRQRVLSGFGTEDTHHNLHTLLFGPDGRLYMNQSVYTRTDAETPFGVTRLKAGGGLRYDTHHRRMDIFFRGLWNPWGHQFDRYGNSFMTDGAGFAGIAYVFPGAMFNPTPGSRRQLDLISPGSYPKFCSGEIVRGPSFPDDWQDSFVTCDFRANRVTRFSLSESGAGFVSKQEADLIRTSASTFRPIDVKQGPDGALYIADWSNPIINHGEVDFRDPRRDRWHGRIWRVSFKDRPSRQKIDLMQSDLDSLAKHLFSNDRYLSDQARRVVIEKALATSDGLSRLLELADSSRDQLDVLRLSAVAGRPDHQLLAKLLADKDPHIRTAATRVLGDWANPADPASSVEHDQAILWLKPAIEDTHPRVRLEAVCALHKLGGLDAIKLSLHAFSADVDKFLDHAVYLGVEQYSETLIADLQDESWSKPENQKQLAFVLSSVQAHQASQFLSQYLSKNKIAGDGSGPWIELIGKAGGVNELRMLYQQAIDGGFEQAAMQRSFAALRDAKRLRNLSPLSAADAAEGLKSLVQDSRSTVQLAAIQLAGVWRVRPLVKELAKLASDSTRSTDIRIAALRALRQCGGDQAQHVLVTVLQSNEAIAVRSAALGGLFNLNPNQAAKHFYNVLQTAEDEPQALTLWRSILSAKNGEKLAVASLPADGINELAARAGIRAAREAGRNAKTLIDTLMPMSGLTMTAAKWSPERSRELVRLVTIKGNAERGEMVYRRSDLQCATCHSIGGVGGKVGPDLTSLGAGAPIDYIIESMFDPNAKIKENYHSVTVLTDAGKVYAGIETGSTDEEMVLRDATNKIIRIPETEIVQVKQGKSLMPEALLDRVPQQDQLDLLRFLTRLGKPGPYDASRQSVGRVLEVFAGTHRLEQQGNQSIVSGERTEGWKPLQARVNGRVDRQVLEQLTAQPRNISLVNIYLRANVQVSSSTRAEFSIENLDDVPMWIDGESAGSTGQVTELSAGRHVVVFQIDARDLPDDITIRCEQVTFLSE